jgi:hypothetical protein
LSPEQFDQEVSQLEVNLDRLRALYEQYFLGIERIEPSVARKTVDRQFWELKRITMRNTARRFRFQTLVQRYNTLQQHWMKVCRQIENGTYPRHIKRAKQRGGDTELSLRKPTLTARTRDEASEPADAPPPAIAAAGASPVQATDEQPRQNPTNAEPPRANRGTPTSEPHPSSSRPSRRISLRPISNDDAQKIRSTLPPAPPAKAVPPPLKREGKKKMIGQTSTAAAHNITDERVGGLYQELQRVRRRLNQDETDISLEALSRSLRATEARLKAKYAGKRIDFRVEIFNGKAVIKPTVKK